MPPETKGQTNSSKPPESTQCLDTVQNASTRCNCAAGVLKDAAIITTRGQRKVQDIRPGELVVTRSGGVVPVDRIEQQSLVAKAIYVIAGSIGHRNMRRDTVLAAGQPVLIRDWRARALGGKSELILHAKHLVDGEYVRNIGLQAMTVYRIHFASQQVFYADGMELGSADAVVDPEVAKRLVF